MSKKDQFDNKEYELKHITEIDHLSYDRGFY